MTLRIVLALYESQGIAEDGAGRLQTEGVPADHIALKRLREIAPTPPMVQTELEALSIDPFVLGNVRETYAPYIRNGETVVTVRAESDYDVQFAMDTLKQYAPMDLRVVDPAQANAAVDSEKAKLPPL